jgi:hypothetical protein
MSDIIIVCAAFTCLCCMSHVCVVDCRHLHCLQYLFIETVPNFRLAAKRYTHLISMCNFIAQGVVVNLTLDVSHEGNIVPRISCSNKKFWLDNLKRRETGTIEAQILDANL